MTADVEHQTGDGHGRQPFGQRRAVLRVVQVRNPVVPGQVGLARLGLEQLGQRVEEVVLAFLAEDGGELAAQVPQGGFVGLLESQATLLAEGLAEGQLRGKARQVEKVVQDAVEGAHGHRQVTVTWHQVNAGGIHGP
jgi:hypothetical protein